MRGLVARREGQAFRIDQLRMHPSCRQIKTGTRSVTVMTRVLGNSVWTDTWENSGKDSTRVVLDLAGVQGKDGRAAQGQGFIDIAAGQML